MFARWLSLSLLAAVMLQAVLAADTFIDTGKKLLTNPVKTVAGCNHDHVLHACLINCGMAGLTDSRNNCDLQASYFSCGCGSRQSLLVGGVTRLATLLQNTAATVVDFNNSGPNGCTLSEGLSSCNQIAAKYRDNCSYQGTPDCRRFSFI
ncbi:hypothetical protein GQ42DRAFT_65429 [Ramicandelaber brevisporus]|nr:hypothetical protein GQ42DRAFT_65429 [Ramicandelaber brevisporus]